MVLNRVMLIGYVGQDPKIANLTTGKVANVTLATTEKGYVNKNGNNIPERTEWHNLVFYGQLADVVEKYVRQGSPLFVEGKLRNRSYEDSQKVSRRVTEVIVDNMQMLPNSKTQ